jgi:O-antigen ligase
MKANVWLALSALIVNFIMNSQYIITSSLEITIINGSHLISFFSSRAYYAFVLIVGVFSAMYIMRQTKTPKTLQWVYIVIIALFIVNIIITGARTQIMELIFALFIYAFSRQKNKLKFTLCVLIAIIIAINLAQNTFKAFIDRYSLILTHDATGMDISTGRFTLWEAAFRNSSILNWIIGHGFGSKDVFLFSNNITVRGGELYGSFHSGYVDMFFESGLIGLLFILVIISKIIVSIINCYPDNVKNFFLPIYSAWFLECFTGAGFMLFTWDSMSLYASYLLVFLPLFLDNYYKKSACIDLHMARRCKSK